jgi:hypothetical protein
MRESGLLGAPALCLPLFTQVRGIEILRTSPFGDSQKLASTEFSEARLVRRSLYATVRSSCGGPR